MRVSPQGSKRLGREGRGSLRRTSSASLREQLGPDDRLVDVHFGVENVNPEDRTTSYPFKVTIVLWQARDQNENSLRTLHPLERGTATGELPNPNQDYPYLGWQGELRTGQKLEGSILFAAPSMRMQVWFTQPVMYPPFGEWMLDTLLELPQAP
jgi:hypothetical protein